MYTKVVATTAGTIEEQNEIVIAFLSEFPFHTFEDELDSVVAYGNNTDFTPQIIEEIKISLAPFVTILTFSEVEKENWNEEWEKNYFDPIWIEDKVCIYAPFHTLVKQPQIPIIIEPKMSFGTGHHATTQLMCKGILQFSNLIKNANVLDMGAGTGVLAILAAKLGATFLHAVDIEQWCQENAAENFEKNGVKNWQSDMGNIDLFTNKPPSYNCIFANIQRTVLLADTQYYTKLMLPNSVLFVSGFYVEDKEAIIANANLNNLKLKETFELDNWCSLVFSN